MIRILEPLDYSEKSLILYRQIGDVSFGPALDIDEQCKVLVVRINYYLDRSLLANYPNLKLIVSPTTGCNHYDINYLRLAKIKVFNLKNVPDKLASIKSTTEHTLMLAIAINRNIGLLMHDYRINGPRLVSTRDLYRGNELSTKRLGILGFGRIGSQLFEMAIPIWKDVLTWDIDPLKIQNLPAKYRARGPKELFRSSDTVCLCINYSPSNLNFVNKSVLDQLHEKACVVNTSRGEVLDEHEIINRFESNAFGGYATDVISDELAIKNHLVIQSLDKPFNILYTPHIGGCTLDAMHFTEEIMAEYVFSFFKCT